MTPKTGHKATKERTFDLLDYDPSTGKFYWKKHRLLSRVGKEAGGLHNGYFRIHIDQEQFLAHRLAWLFHYGEFPKGCIDHKNRIKTDNRISNLRDVLDSTNQRNVGKSRKNTSGITRVSWSEKSGKWRAYIHDGNGKEVHLGLFFSMYAAWEARLNAEDMYGYSEARFAESVQSTQESIND